MSKSVFKRKTSQEKTDHALQLQNKIRKNQNAALEKVENNGVEPLEEAPDQKPLLNSLFQV